jgi:hypothetical protein
MIIANICENQKGKQNLLLTMEKSGAIMIKKERGLL